VKGRENFGNLPKIGRIILKLTLKKQESVDCTVFISLRIKSNGGVLSTWQ
jgi:hypothetical protein